MKQAAALVVSLLLAPAAALALTPRDFAYGLPIVTDEPAAAYSVEVPLEVYRGCVNAALADIRIFNAQGEIVPYALKRREAQPPAPSPARSLPVFPLSSASRVVIDGVRVTIDASQSVNVQAQKGRISNSNTVGQYVVDGRALDTAVSAFELKWADSSAQFSGRIRVDASDDLNVWRTVAPAAPIANLQANGQQLIERRVEMPAAKARYWRLTWLGAEPPFEIAEVWAEPAERPVEAPRMELVVPGTADSVKPGVYLFDLGAQLPVERVNLELQELNTVIAADLDSRAGLADPWHEIVHTGFYRLQSASGEQSNGPVAIGVDQDRYWRARIAGSAAMPKDLRLKVLWTPNEIVFLARGEGPFLLAYGDTAAQSAEADLASIPSTIPVVHATFGAPRVLGGGGRSATAPEPFLSKPRLLWLVLIAGVCVLGWMAYRLIREQP